VQGIPCVSLTQTILTWYTDSLTFF
jgi:hypothetical protein